MKKHYQEYANPEALVSTEWVADHLNEPDVCLVESNEDPLVYSSGHIPGAVEIDWTRDLNQPLRRDFLQPPAFQSLLRRKGISEGMTVVFYGDRNNWWAAYAYYIFSLFKLPLKLRLMDGGRLKWVREGRELEREQVQPESGSIAVKARLDNEFRAGRGMVLDSIENGRLLLDVRSGQEYTGEALHMPGYLSDGALRAGRLPGAVHLHWEECVRGEFAEFKSRAELENLYKEHGAEGDPESIIYCRIGKRSSHNWFVQTQLLGRKNVRNYDSGWLEWGNLFDVPIER